MVENISELLVHRSTSLRETMAAIDAAASGIVFVVDSDDVLRGTATDGDIRRALFEGVSLDDPISEVMNANPVRIREFWSPGEVSEYINDVDLPADSLTVPVVDDEGVVTDVTYLQGDIPLFQINWTEDDLENVFDSISRGSYWAKGPYVDEFESGIEDYLNVEHAISVNSGTTALVTALKTTGIGPGDEVIVPSFTFIATANSVRLAGAEPVFADIERETFGLDPSSVEEQITDDTTAVVPVHVYGEPCKITEIVEVADDHGLYVIEDAAAAMGAKQGEEFVGTIGDVGIYSFAQNKIITTGEGGAVVTDDESIAHEAQLYRSHGRISEGYFDSPGTGEYVSLGSNYRMPDMNAAVGSAQLGRIDRLIEKRQEMAKMLSDRLEGIDGIQIPRTTDRRHVYQLYTIVLDDQLDRDQIIKDLERQGISSKVYWDPIHRTKYYSSHPPTDASDLSVTNEVSNNVLSLPFYPDISQREIEQISDCVENAIGNVAR